VALRNGRRWIRSYEKVALPEAGEGFQRLRDQGVYLITGGLGGIGLALAGELARRSRAKLVLMGRTAARTEAIAALEALGAQVELVAGDAANATDLRAAIARANERFGALHGVIHAAGIPGGGLIQLRDRAAAEAVFAGKLQGAMALATALDGLALDFVALCSSVTAVVAMPGQADYVAANAALDALAAAQSRQGQRWLSINWDAWREAGMAARLDSPELASFRTEMLRDGLSNAEGASCFGAALGSGLAQVIVSTHPLAARLAQPRALDIAAPPKPAATAGESLAAAPGAPLPDLDEVEQRIATVWQEMLGVHRVGVHDNFFELGGTSLIGIKIIGRLRSELGVEISEVGLFQAPTVSTLAGLIRDARTQTAPADEAQTRGQRRRERRTRR